MQVVDLFSGIGGFSLSASWLNWRTIHFCEIDEFCKRVLSCHFPNIPIHNDIKTLTAEQVKSSKLYDKNEATIVVGGFPCQPFSVAGKRKGTDDNRYLWPETHAFIKAFQPCWAVLENVPGLITWDDGMVFKQVCSDLESCGYEVQAFVLPAAGINAPHRRDRLWIVAHSISRRSSRQNITNSRSEKYRNNGKTQSYADSPSNGVSEQDSQSNKIERTGKTSDEQIIGRQLKTIFPDRLDDVLRTPADSEGSSKSGRLLTRQGEGESGGRDSKINVPNPDNEGLQRGKIVRGSGKRRKGRDEQSPGFLCPDWSEFPTQSPLCDRNDGIPNRLANITFSKWRKESLKTMGNAIVPQVVLQIFKTIEAYEKLNK
jgi:DNA (cytosine-5)-methyltransferase 1